MQINHDKVSAGSAIVLGLLLLNAIVLERGYVSSAKWYQLTWITIPLLLFCIFRFRQKPS